MRALNLSDRFSKIRPVVTFLTVGLQQHFVCRVCVCVCVCVCVYDLSRLYQISHVWS